MSSQKHQSETVPAEDVQVVGGHLATTPVSEALTFGGIGVGRNCRGAVVSLVSVEILEFELKNCERNKRGNTTIQEIGRLSLIV